jgi:hypothetical protein
MKYAQIQSRSAEIDGKHAGGNQIRVFVQFIARGGLDSETVLLAIQARPACSSLEEV